MPGVNYGPPRLRRPAGDSVEWPCRMMLRTFPYHIAPRAERPSPGCMPMRLTLFRTDIFPVPLPPGHRFPLAKYAGVVRWAQQQGRAFELRVPPAASDEQLSLVHTRDYLTRLAAGELTPLEIRRIGFPWSAELVERSRRSVGATICAAQLAWQRGFAANLAGGTHHAFSDSGQGYCVFNDVAVAARALQRTVGPISIAVIDCDVHQGNGTAHIFAADPSVFTFSIHGAKNFPFRKCDGDLDIALPDATDDATYLAALKAGLEEVFARSRPQFVFYIAGADPYVGDRLGRLSLTKPGLAARDRLVLAACRERHIPVALTLGGGYAPNVDDIIAIHAQSLDVARRVFTAPG